MVTLIFFLLFTCSVINVSRQDMFYNSPELWICSGLKQGTQIPHPEYCSSYFVCNNGFPDTVICEGDLHYDRRYKVCNWQSDANCTLGEYPPNWNKWNSSEITTKATTIEVNSTTPTTLKSTTTTLDPTIATTEPTVKTSPKLDTTTIMNCISSTSLPTENPSNSTTGATDDSGNSIDPLEKYNPLNVQCFHNGLYFLPHPVICHKYFICSNHVLYLHQCGYGTYWNYEKEQCDLRQNSICYNSDENTGTETTRKRKTTTIKPKPPTTIPTRVPTTYRTTSNVPGSEIYTTTKIDSTTKKRGVPECPLKNQKFLPHPTDCTKYYICIAGIAALTTCPNGMYWDEREEWCGYPEFTYCRAAIVKPPILKN